MSEAPKYHESESGVTRVLADHCMGMTIETLPDRAVTWAKHCLLDGIGVTLAGSQELLAKILAEQVGIEGGSPQATIFGTGLRTNASQAVLVNGSAAHALDYDDVQSRLHGHPTVPVAPVVLALAERDCRDGRQVLTAFASGFEAECRVGAYVGKSHYERGWHATATIGTFGAAVAAASMLGLDGERCATAMGIAGTQAAGLKSMFGTMCKPLHAGKAAQNGLLAAELAGRGFTSRPDVLETHQGFAFTQADTQDLAAALSEMGETYEVCSSLFKYHAACYGTHAAIEAASKIRDRSTLDPNQIERIDIAVGPSWLNVCNILSPTTGLEGKFSLRFCVAMALAGEDTARLSSYSDENVCSPPLVVLRDKATVAGKENLGGWAAEVTVHTTDGVIHQEAHDAGVPVDDLGQQWSRLADKFQGCAAPVVGEAKADAILKAVQNLEAMEDLSELAALCTP